MEDIYPLTVILTKKEAIIRKVTFREWVGQNRTPYRTDFAYDIENKPTQIGYGLTAAERENTKVTYSYDGLGRTATRTVKVNGTPYAANYTYLPGGHGEGSTTGLISAITQGSGNNAENFTYTYDNVGNISSVTQNGKLTSYAYDPLGQLIRVNDQNDLTSGENGTTWTYAYDLGGNILNKKRYAYTVDALPETALETVTYAYTDDNWKDKLTEFNGSYITYDEIGNPTSDGEWLYAWEKGRQLKAMSKASETVVFEYNASGLRVKKIATSTGTTHYTLHGKQITHLTNGNNTLHFFYDAAGKPAMVEWNNGTTTQKFAYIHNLQGDIVGIIDSTGAKVVSYTYDAWGKPLSTTGSLATTLGKLNPFRYRGYVFDEETGLYYLKSRYYNPIWNRFCNKDSYLGKASCIFSHNLFSYCLNSPVLRYDPFGRASQISVGFVFADDTKLYRNDTFLKHVPLGSMYTLRGVETKNGKPAFIINSDNESTPECEEYIYKEKMIAWFGFSETAINGFCRLYFEDFFDTRYKKGYHFLRKENNYGVKNAAVQVMLKMYFTYYSPTPIDINICAAFEDNMLLAVEEFQRQEGLEVDGIFGRGSYLRLVSRLKELKDITWGINDLQ